MKPSRIDMWFDPMDPWSWIVSRWLLEVRSVRGIDIGFHVMSVSLLNAGREVPGQYRDDPDAYRERMRRAWAPVRVATAAIVREGQDVLADLYTAMGRRIHEEGNDDYESVIQESLKETGLPADLADAAHTDAHDDALRASHQAGLAPVGSDVGSPIVHLAGAAFFDAVISRIPRGEQAGSLFDALAAMARFPHFWELKRTRLEEPEFG